MKHLEKEHISQVSVPLLSNENVQQKINDTVLEANRKRTEAYNWEQEALKILDERLSMRGENGELRFSWESIL